MSRSSRSLLRTLGTLGASLSLILGAGLSASAAGPVPATTTPASQDAIVFDGSPGADAPPPGLGPYTMTKFDSDSQPEGFVSGVSGPTGQVGFSSALFHTLIGSGWNTWSNGYTGDVYTTGGLTHITIALPADTGAFYFYAEPNPYATFHISATAQDGTTSGLVNVNGYAGAQYYGFYALGNERIASITVDSTVDFAIGEFGISAADSIKPALNYVALGDSYSSGEGNPPFEAGTDGNGDYCHRSPDAYPNLLGQALKSAPLFYACAGAISDNLTKDAHWTEGPQLNEPGTTTADLTTVTIGGNDANFMPVLRSCIEQTLAAPLTETDSWLGTGIDPSCVSSPTFTASVNKQIDDVYKSVERAYRATRVNAEGHGGSVIAAGYPRVFPTTFQEQTCSALSPFLTVDDQNFLNTAADRLDNVLAGAAGDAGVSFVDVRASFAGHAVCGSGGAWINGISFASGNDGTCTWEVLGQCLIPGVNPVGSFHPNAAGHANGYAPSFQNFITQAGSRTAAGMPVNPTPAMSASTMAETITPLATAAAPRTATTVNTPRWLDSFTDLTALPVTPASAACEGSFQAGQQATVTASGFAAGASVKIVGAGTGIDSHSTIATLTADQNGTVAGTVRIPLTATGFTPADAKAGIVFLDALGTGADGTHRDANAMVGLVPHGNPCGTVETLPFNGFQAPVADAPTANEVQPGSAVPVKFSIPGSSANLASLLANGYPVTAPTSCTNPDLSLTAGDPTIAADTAESTGSDAYNYVWKTDPAWSGCKELIMKLVDGTYHRALFEFRR